MSKKWKLKKSDGLLKIHDGKNVVCVKLLKDEPKHDMFLGKVGDKNAKELNKEAEANFELIVLAPEMLNVCKEALRMYEAIEPVGGWQGVYDELKYVIGKTKSDG